MSDSTTALGGPTTSCPRCRSEGRSVGPPTLIHLLDPAALRPSASTARLCATPDCDIAYYDATGVVAEKEAVVVPIFHKETNPDRPVCYCFGHSVAAVVDAQRDDGSNPIVEAITAACRKGLGRCEEANPQGRCCLGNVRSVAKSGDRTQCCTGCS